MTKSFARSSLAALAISWFTQLAFAGVEWRTELNPPPKPIRLSDQSLASSSSGGTYIAGYTDAGQGGPIFLTRLNQSGAVSWERWITGSLITKGSSILVHPDESVSVAFGVSTSSPPFCIANYLLNGAERHRTCFPSLIPEETTVVLATDGDVVFATGRAPRAVAKLSSTGVLRWRNDRVETSGLSPVNSYGISSDGHYFEVQNSVLRRWNSLDGTLIDSHSLFDFPQQEPVSQFRTVSISRSGSDFVAIGDINRSSPASTAVVSRYGASGARRWATNITFSDGSGLDAVYALLEAPDDGVYAARTRVSGGSEVVAISSNGAIRWSRAYPGTHSIITTKFGLLAIRSTFAGGQTTDYLSLLSDSTGDTLTTQEYVRSGSDARATTYWRAHLDGVLPTLAAPFGETSYKTRLEYVALQSLQRWVYTPKASPDAFAHQIDCVMPRVARGEDGSYFARTQSGEFESSSSWTSVRGSDGAELSATTLPVSGCGFPLLGDSSQIVVSGNAANRVRRLSSSGTEVWRVPGIVSASGANTQPLITTALDGDILYAIGNVVGRVTAAGQRVFEINTIDAIPRYLRVDDAGNAWFLSAYRTSPILVTKVSATGQTLWTRQISTSYDDFVTAKLLGSNAFIIATITRDDFSIIKLGSDGSTHWQRSLVGQNGNRVFHFNDFVEDALGNVYAGGCTNGDEDYGKSIVASWTSEGNERWRTSADLLANGAECVTSLVFGASGALFASASGVRWLSAVEQRPVLWSLDSQGQERWRDRHVLGSPNAARTELLADPLGALVALGDAQPDAFGGRRSTLRKINPLGIVRSGNVVFSAAPTNVVEYREPFSLRVRLVDDSGNAISADADITAYLGLHTGIGGFDGAVECIILAGRNECEIGEIRYNSVESNVQFSVSANGFKSSISPPLSFKRATVSVLHELATSAPHNAYSVQRFKAVARGPAPHVSYTQGRIYGPDFPSYPMFYRCINSGTPDALPVSDCEFLLRNASLPFQSRFVSESAYYENSQATVTSMPVTKVKPTLLVSPDPENTYFSGDRQRFRVSVMVNGTFNATPFVRADAIIVNGQGCSSSKPVDWLNASITEGFRNAYVNCDVESPAAGTPTDATFSFEGDADLHAPDAVTISFSVSLGSVIRTQGGGLPDFVVSCATNPAISCTRVGDSNQDLQCVGPVGATGNVFLVPQQNTGWVFWPSPLLFTGRSGLETLAPIRLHAASSTCQADVDGDGSILAVTDGVLILRAMLGLDGASLISGTTHSCAPRDAAAISAHMAGQIFDIDGDNRVDLATDGILLLRAMFGFVGGALIDGALGANAIRTSPSSILSHLATRCGFNDRN